MVVLPSPYSSCSSSSSFSFHNPNATLPPPLAHASRKRYAFAIVASHRLVLPRHGWSLGKVSECAHSTLKPCGSLLHQSFPRDAGTSIIASALSSEVQSLTTAAIASLMSFGALRAFVYFRIQYIIAAMLGRHVPRGGARVLDLDIREGRNLYYYPNDVKDVVAFTRNQYSQVVKNQALRAGVKVDIRSKELTALGLPSNSVDAVVSVYCLCDIPDNKLKEVLCEAVRVLKPGKPFIFVENVGAEWQIVRVVQKLLQSTFRALGYHCNATRNLLQYLQESEGLEDLEHEFILGFQDPHLVGVARKLTSADFKKVIDKKGKVRTAS